MRFHEYKKKDACGIAQVARQVFAEASTHTHTYTQTHTHTTLHYTHTHTDTHTHRHTHTQSFKCSYNGLNATRVFKSRESLIIWIVKVDLSSSERRM